MPFKARSRRVVSRMHTVDLGDIESAEVLFMADLHAGDDAHDMDRFLADVAYVRDTPDTYCFINGDLYQAESRHTVGVPNNCWSVKDTRHYLARTLKPLVEAGKLLGINRGNHDARVYRHSTEDSIDALVCELGCHYFETGEADLRIKLGENPNSGSRIAYGIFAAHGCRGGRTEGARANAVSDLRKVRTGADVYLMSHVHAGMVIPKRVHRYDLMKGNVIAQDVLLIVTPSYQKRDGYATDRNFEPQPTGAIHVTFDGRWKGMSAKV